MEVIVMHIYFKGCYTVLGKIECRDKKKRFCFVVAVKDEPNATVYITPGDGTIESFHEAETSDAMVSFLKEYAGDSGKKLPPNLSTELSRATSVLSQSTRRVLTHIKYGLNQKDLDEQLFSVRDKYWSLDNDHWERLPMLTSVVGSVDVFLFLTDDTARAIQEYLKFEAPEPFLALRHLHRARREGNPRHKWIDATIAAELGIKEFLLRKKPDLEALLLEMPSPPLNKLYGAILKQYGGESSPWKNKIAKGAEVRNDLLHIPRHKAIAPWKANEYVNDVQSAIYHLLALLYPEDPLVDAFHKPKKTIKLKPLRTKNDSP
jgi:hypothetical protein